VRVDGQDSYSASTFQTFGTSGAPVNPDPVLAVDPTNGLGSASSQNNMSGCSPGPYPPDNTTCAGAVPNGVRIDHSANALRSGELVATRDTFVSTDGHAHAVDVWFAQSAGTNGVSWRFPGQTSFTAHTGGQELSGLPSGPGATIQDGQNCFGVLAWSAAPDTVHFLDGDRLYTHYALSLPAGGSSTISYAYGSTFTEDEANALAPAVLAAVSPSPATPPAGGGGGLPPAAGTAKFGKLKIGRDGTVTVIVNVPSSGSVSGSETAVVTRSAKKRTKKLIVSRARTSAAKAGQVKLVLKLNKKGKKLFLVKHKLPITLVVIYKPATGSGNKLTRHLTLKLKKQRRK
jgi:hypothetical protein